MWYCGPHTYHFPVSLSPCGATCMYCLHVVIVVAGAGRSVHPLHVCGGLLRSNSGHPHGTDSLVSYLIEPAELT